MASQIKQQLHKPSLWILIFMVSVGPFGDTEYIPSLPHIAQSFGVSYALAQYTMTSYLAGYAIFQLIYGITSDRFGRKPMMLIGAVTFVIGSLICYLSSSIEMLIFGRLIQGMGSCAGAILSSASVRDAFPVAQRSQIYARINAAFALAPGFGPIIGGYVHDWFGWHANFLLLLILSGLLFVCVWFFYPETNQNLKPDALGFKKIKSTHKSLFADPYYSAYLLIMGMCISVVYCCLIESPALVIILLKLTAKDIAFIAMGVMFGFMTGSIVCARLTRKVPDNYIICIGLAIMMISSAAMIIFAFTHFVTLASMLIPIITIFAGIAFINPIVTANALLPFHTITGAASAMLGFSQMAVAALATGMLAVFRDNSARNMPVTFSILTVIAALIFILFILLRPGRRRVIV